jgi:predicted transcriptional regulator
MKIQTKLAKETRKKMLFDYLKKLKNPVNAWSIGEKFDMTARRATQLLDEMAEDDLVIKSKNFKEQTFTWKKTIVNYYEVKAELKANQVRKPKVPMNWHNPFGLGVRS